VPARRFIVEVCPSERLPDREGEAILHVLRELGIAGATGVRTARLYELAGALDRGDAERAAAEVLADPVAERYAVAAPEGLAPAFPGRIFTVIRRPGVMDPVVGSLRKALLDLGIGERVTSVRVGRRAYVDGTLAADEVERAARKALANPLIEEVIEGPGFPPKDARRARPAPRRTIPIADLERANRERGLSLSAVEIEAIAAHFRGLGRAPTDVELETIAQTWSEHCKHKTIAGPVRYRGPMPWTGAEAVGGEKRYGSLLKETIVRATRELARPWCLSVFVDNAGVIALDDELGVAMKVETHNHPSALEPYGGAGTGVGGVIRDILGTGLGATPVAGTDVFCVAPPDTRPEDVPTGALHPRRVLRGVVAGVRDYGNRMGIPTLDGAVVFDRRYVGNPLVYCGTVGVIPRDRVAKAPARGDAIVVAGGRTGRDGIHGATFSSAELTEESERLSSGAVQIGNAIEEKRVHDVLLEARDRGLFRAVTDCGAGGLSSAVGEMAETLGAEVQLERVPLKYEGLTPAEIWISEAQERMVLAVPPERQDELLALFAAEDVEATPIGSFTGTGDLVLRHGDVEVGRLDGRFLHDGLPRVEREAAWRAPERREPPVGSYAGRPGAPDLTADALALLASWDVCSKEWIVRQYDHEVQGTGVVKPLVGAREDGPGDAAVLVPARVVRGRAASRTGIAVGCGICPRYGDLDPYLMALAAVDEAVRNVVAVGGDPDRTALLDNFSWGDCRREETLGALVLACEGCLAAALGLGAPFISGKDSLNNELETAAGRRAIPPTLLVSALAIVPDIARSTTSDLKRAGDPVYQVGLTRAELGGSAFHALRGLAGGAVPRAAPRAALETFRAVHAAIRAGEARAVHDLSEGGLGVAAAEMAIGGRLGLDLDLAAAPAPDVRDDAVLLFSETPSRFLVEVGEAAAPAFERRLAGAGVPVGRLGRVTDAAAGVRIVGLDGRAAVASPLEPLVAAFRGPLGQALG